tara:strand:+ start:200 stop:469 length:270 start_codon:yes stop_codon:yes gene_type:complete
MSYYERNKELVLSKRALLRWDIHEYNKLYYQSHKSSLCEKSQAWDTANKYMVVCECGRSVQRNKLAHHLHTPIHKRLFEHLLLEELNKV